MVRKAIPCRWISCCFCCFRGQLAADARAPLHWERATLSTARAPRAAAAALIAATRSSERERSERVESGKSGAKEGFSTTTEVKNKKFRLTKLKKRKATRRACARSFFFQSTSHAEPRAALRRPKGKNKKLLRSLREGGATKLLRFSLPPLFFSLAAARDCFGDAVPALSTSQARSLSLGVCRDFLVRCPRGENEARQSPRDDLF